MYCAGHDSTTCGCYDSQEKIQAALIRLDKSEVAQASFKEDLLKRSQMIADLPKPIVCVGCGRRLENGKCPFLVLVDKTEHDIRNR